MHKRLAALLLTGATVFVLQTPACAAASGTDSDTHVHVLSGQLYCLVYQNQTLADSNADLAVDLRRQTREQLCTGTTEADVKDYLVQRYGDFVLYRPPVKRSMCLLWLGPVLLLMAVVFGIVLSHKQQRPTPSELDVDAQARLTALLIMSPSGDPRQ